MTPSREQIRGLARSLDVSTTQEWDLIRRCQGGATAAFEPLVRAHEGPALGYASALLGDRDEAADALQDAFVLAYRSLGRLRPGSPFGPWFRTILRNVCMDRLRSPRLRRRVPLASHRAARSARVDAVAGRDAERADMAEHIADALRHLPEEQRVVLLMRELEGMSYAEIAAALELPAGTVASRLNHARAALRDALIAQGIGLEDIA